MVKVFFKNLINLFLLLFVVKCDRRVMLRSLQEMSRQGTHDTIGKALYTPHHHIHIAVVEAGSIDRIV